MIDNSFGLIEFGASVIELKLILDLVKIMVLFSPSKALSLSTSSLGGPKGLMQGRTKVIILIKSSIPRIESATRKRAKVAFD